MESKTPAPEGNSFLRALEYSTNLILPERTYTEHTDAKAFFFYPVIGLAEGMLAAILPLTICAVAGHLQGVVLASGLIYVFMLEWLTGFKFMKNFAKICSVKQTHTTRAERIAMLESENESVSCAGAACIAMLVGAKILIVYILFLRLAIFENLSFLAFALVFTPVFARICMLWTASAKGSFFITAALVANFLVFSYITCVYLGLVRIYNVFATADSFSVFFAALGDFITTNGIPFIIVTAGARFIFYILAAGFAVHLIWTVQAKRLFGSIPAKVLSAVSETAEISVLTAFLLIGDILFL